jgi:hypothetical protein
MARQQRQIHPGEWVRATRITISISRNASDCVLYWRAPTRRVRRRGVEARLDGLFELFERQTEEGTVRAQAFPREGHSLEIFEFLGGGQASHGFSFPGRWNRDVRGPK